MADNMWNRENGEGEMVVVKVDNGRDGAKCAIGNSPLLFTSQTSSKLKFPSTTTICVTVTYYCKNLWRIASPRLIYLLNTYYHGFSVIVSFTLCRFIVHTHFIQCSKNNKKYQLLWMSLTQLVWPGNSVSQVYSMFCLWVCTGLSQNCPSPRPIRTRLTRETVQKCWNVNFSRVGGRLPSTFHPLHS